MDTLRGHVNNVSCVMFHARQVRTSLLLPHGPPLALLFISTIGGQQA